MDWQHQIDLGVGPEPGDVAHSPLDLIRQQAHDRPGAPALVVEGRVTSYADLELAVGCVATELRSRGIGEGSRVGLLLHRNEWLPICVLAVLQAGATYVPLSPAWPEARNSFICVDAGIALVVTELALSECAPEFTMRCTVEETLRHASTATASLGDRADPRVPAYVAYTSGTTGRPKGVIIERGSLARFVDSTRTIYRLGRSDRCLQFADLTFDVSALEILCALSGGGSLHIASTEQRNDPGALTALLRDDCITFADLPPAIVPLLQPESFPHLRLLSMGGEPVSRVIVAAWATEQRQVVNSYGPTEATVAVSLSVCDAGRAGPPTIGRPMPGQRVLVLDQAQQPVPSGVAGEIYIGGSQLARGYVNRPSEEGARFVSDPFTPGARLFRTGDLARWESDGELSFLGRADRQAKVRGVRVELEEIETVLTEMHNVKQAAVVAPPDKRHVTQLHAFVVMSHPDVSAQSVRRAAAARLVPQAVPRIRPLGTLPLTSAGKVDLRRLEQLAQTDIA